MPDYITPIFFGILVSLGLFYLISLPVAIFQYRKYNGILRKKSFIMASFILYMIIAWFMTILPLPNPQTVATMDKIQPNFKPFLFVTTFLEKSGFNLHDKSTWLKALKHNSFYSVAFNVLLTFPFGVYMKKYFHKSFLTTVLLGFLLSFFYEFTQYTGLFGIYPHAYRVADVDDLIVNTFGAVLGYISTPLISKLLPTMEEGSLPVERQINVGLVRRLIAFVIDMLAVSIFSSLLSFPLALLKISSPILTQVPTVIVYFLYFFLMVYVTDGKTFGYQLLNIKIIPTEGVKLSFWQILVRNGFLLFFTVFLPFIQSTFSSPDPSSTKAILLSFLFLLEFLFPVILIVTRLRKKFVFFYERLSKTRLTSKTIHVSSPE